MQAITVTRQGIAPGIMLADDKTIPIGDQYISPHPDRYAVSSRGILYDLHLVRHNGLWYWHSEPDLVSRTDDEAVVLINTRHDGKKDTHITTRCVLANEPSSELRSEDNRWIVGLAHLEAGDFLEYKPEWSSEPMVMRWIPDDMGITVEEAQAFKQGRRAS